MIDEYLHERAYVMKHMIASARDKNFNLEEDTLLNDIVETSSVFKPSSGTSSLQVKDGEVGHSRWQNSLRN